MENFNPRTWSGQHAWALIIAVALGVLLSLSTGYAMSHASSFSRWFMPHREYAGAYSEMLWGGLPWAAIGAITGAALVYLVKLLR